MQAAQYTLLQVRTTLTALEGCQKKMHSFESQAELKQIYNDLKQLEQKLVLQDTTLAFQGQQPSILGQTPVPKPQLPNSENDVRAMADLGPLLNLPKLSQDTGLSPAYLQSVAQQTQSDKSRTEIMSYMSQFEPDVFAALEGMKKNGAIFSDTTQLYELILHIMRSQRLFEPGSAYEAPVAQELTKRWLRRG